MKSTDFPDSFYRVAVKGLFVQNDKVLTIKEPKELTGQWELPGGGLEFGEHPHVGLRREVEEELQLKVLSISEYPIYVWTARFEGRRNMDWFYSMVLAYQIELESLNFTATAECEAIKMCTKNELFELDLYHQAAHLRKHFDPNDFKKEPFS